MSLLILLCATLDFCPKLLLWKHRWLQRDFPPSSMLNISACYCFFFPFLSKLLTGLTSDAWCSLHALRGGGKQSLLCKEECKFLAFTKVNWTMSFSRLFPPLAVSSIEWKCARVGSNGESSVNVNYLKPGPQQSSCWLICQWLLLTKLWGSHLEERNSCVQWKKNE